MLKLWLQTLQYIWKQTPRRGLRVAYLQFGEFCQGLQLLRGYQLELVVRQNAEGGNLPVKGGEEICLSNNLPNSDCQEVFAF